jgi:hypothetical protein
MAGVITTSQTFANNDNVTSTTLNAIATGSAFGTITDVCANTTITVSAGKLKVGTITSTEMGTDSVLTANIANLNITTAKLADTAVTTAKITDLNVTTGKIADLGVTTAKIADSNVTTAKIADANITAAKLNGGQTGSAPIYGVRAWVVFDMTRNAAGGTDSANTARYIYANGNVSSVVKNNTGDFTVNFTTVLPDTFYTYSGSGLDADETGDMIIGRPASGGKTTSGIRLKVINLSGTAVNRSEVAVSFIR